MPTISPFMIYLWSMADGIKDTIYSGAIPFFIISLVGFIITTIISIAGANDLKENTLAKLKQVWGVCRNVAIAALLVLFAQSLIPSSKTIAMMAIIPAITNGSVVQKDIPELYDAAKEAAVSLLKEQAQKIVK